MSRCIASLFMAAFVVIALGVCTPELTAAAVVLDQEYNPPSPNLFAGNGGLYRAQTFTVGLTGQMVRIETLMQGTGSSVFEIWNTIAGAPVPIVGTALASSTINFSSASPTFAGVDITAANLYVTVGDVLAIVQIGGSSTGSGSWSGRSPGTYGAGAPYTTTFSDPSGAWTADDWDFGFRTFVTPEPTSFALAAFGFAGLAAWNLRRRKR